MKNLFSWIIFLIFAGFIICAGIVEGARREGERIMQGHAERLEILRAAGLIKK